MQPSADHVEVVKDDNPAATEADAPTSADVAEETPTREEAPFPLADAGPYYDGLWYKHPHYQCPACSYGTIDGSGAVDLHIITRADQGSKAHVRYLNEKKEA